MKTVSVLEQRVIKVLTLDKFSELQKSGQIPVCVFATGDDFNAEMLSHLTSKLHKLVCAGEVDLTASTCKWNRKMTEQLEKLNSDSLQSSFH